MMTVKIKTSEPQRKFINSKARHPAFVAGYGAGKSHAAVLRIIRLALTYNGLNFGFIEPTYDLIRLIALPRFAEVLDKMQVGYFINKTDGTIALENGSLVIFRSAENPERLVGFEVADAVIDEADTLRPEKAHEVWIKMIGRCRQKKPDKKQNTLAAVSTPEGFGFMYDLWGKELRDGYELIKAPTYSNKRLPESYIDQLKATYSSSYLAAYLDGEFVNLNTGNVYYEFDRKLNASSEIVKQSDVLHIGMDFNVANMSAVVHVIRDNDTPHAVDEITSAFDTPTIARIIKERYPNHKIMIYPDASGQSRKSNNASTSDHAVLRSFGFQVLTNNRNPFVKDRVLSFNNLIHSKEQRRYFVNVANCPSLTEALEKQAYDKSGEPDKKSGFDHVVDAAGYFVAYRYPIVSNYTQFATVMGL